MARIPSELGGDAMTNCSAAGKVLCWRIKALMIELTVIAPLSRIMSLLKKEKTREKKTFTTRMAALTKSQSTGSVDFSLVELVLNYYRKKSATKGTVVIMFSLA